MISCSARLVLLIHGCGWTQGVAQLMQIWPAIDLRGGRCVRLVQGDYQRETVYGDDPVATAREWAAQGADFLHIVDLDGARSGRPINHEAIKAVVKETNLICEVGGGIRDEAAISEFLEIGVDRVIIGTQALRQPDWFQTMCAKYPGRLVLGIDARDGFVATDGWLDLSQCTAIVLARQFLEVPLAAVVYTDIATDGMLGGPNFEAVRQMRQAVDVPILASGGIQSAEDIERLAEIPVEGCIVGRAFYEGRLSIEEALTAAAAN
jgi:phosphoribosylformimino-5-aminoimidazole carboxamide ribotide isomerase